MLPVKKTQAALRTTRLRFRERGTQVILGVRPCVIKRKLETLGLEIARGRPEIDPVIPGVAIGSAKVDVAELIVGAARFKIRRIQIGVAIVCGTAKVTVDVGDRVLVDAARAGIFQCHNRIPHNFMIDRKRVCFSVGGLNIGIHRAQRYGRENGRTRSGEWSEIVSRERVGAAGKGHDCVCRRILNDVEGHVSEITLIADAVAAADRCLSISE